MTSSLNGASDVTVTHVDEGFVDEIESLELRSPAHAPLTDDEKQGDDGIGASGSESTVLPPQTPTTLVRRAGTGSSQVGYRNLPGMRHTQLIMIVP